MSIKYFFIFLFVLACSSVYAIDYRLISPPPNCVGDITVNLDATQPIDVGEYTFLWCNNTSHVWACPCDKPVVLSVQTNTVNKYNIQITYTTQTTSSSSGGSSRHTYVLVQNNDTIQVKQNQYIRLPENFTNFTNNTPINPFNASLDNNITVNYFNGTITYQNDTEVVPIVVEPNAGEIEQYKEGFFKRLWSWIKKILMYDIGGKK